ncbi:cryptochrome/photolyase family protein [Spongiimicrobium salis]|uniref:cryptochrome/photolyase family protein n=1 Tax=Spongiimicrobium salis TaxID=1667022 RepID=UPI00374D747E
MSAVNIVFPHHLFEEGPLLQNGLPCYVIEEFLFFRQYKFHKQKIAYHRASMKYYADFLKKKEISVTYIDAHETHADIRNLIPFLFQNGIREIHTIATTDDWLERRISKECVKLNILLHTYESPLFLNSRKDLQHFFKPDKKKYHQTTFYTDQRKRRKIMLNPDGSPEGGKWTFDTENRKKYPVKKIPPPIQFPDTNLYFEEAKTYVSKFFSNHLGKLSESPLYPCDHKSAKKWLDQFLEYRFMEFGTYEDAIVAEEVILHHSVLTPMLNVGLITPEEVLEKALNFAEKQGVPINSKEGFIRQIIGWREFVRGMYTCQGRFARTRNFWCFDRKIPASFYDGTTGIVPVDQTIKKILKTGYCHHIERLMVLGNFMLLCEFDPNEVYQWFMELFIDAYDWVMVPNAYGMSQFADGGLFATKPYIGGSNYLKKMGNYPKGDWQDTWDGLFWRFMDKQRGFFLQNPRLGMLVRMYDKMPEEKRLQHLNNANTYLENI